MAAVAHLGRAEIGIESSWVGRSRIFKRTENHAIPDVARGAGNAFLLILRIELEVRLFDAPSRRGFAECL